MYYKLYYVVYESYTEIYMSIVTCVTKWVNK